MSEFVKGIVKLAREYRASDQDALFARKRIANGYSDDIYDLRVNRNIVKSIMSNFKASNKLFFYIDYDIKEQLLNILDYYNIRQNYPALSNTTIKIIFLPKSVDVLTRETNIDKQKAIEYINFWLSGECTGRTIEQPNLMCIIASVIQQGKNVYLRNDRAIAKTLRHELEHACQIILGLQDEDVKQLNEDKKSQYFQTFADFSRKRQIGRYTNDMREDIQDYDLDSDFFFDYAENHYSDDIDTIFRDVNNVSIQILDKTQHDNKITNQDIANDLLFLCSLRKYNQSKYQSIKNTFG